MCSCNGCQGSGWLRYWRRNSLAPDGYDVEQEPCRCNPTAEPEPEHSDQECYQDVTLGP